MIASVCLRFHAGCNRLTYTPCAEFIIADLALASYAIPSFTLASPSLLSSVLDSHPPSVVITDASLLSALLELLYDSNDSIRPTIVVVGAINSNEVPNSELARLLRWEDIESSGSKEEKLAFATPSMSWAAHDGRRLTVPFRPT